MKCPINIRGHDGRRILEEGHGLGPGNPLFSAGTPLRSRKVLRSTSWSGAGQCGGCRCGRASPTLGEERTVRRGQLDHLYRAVRRRYAPRHTIKPFARQSLSWWFLSSRVGSCCPVAAGLSPYCSNDPPPPLTLDTGKLHRHLRRAEDGQLFPRGSREQKTVKSGH